MSEKPSYFDIVIRYNPKMSRHALRIVEMELNQYAKKFTPNPKIKVEMVK